jgi:hypothetical protein
VYPPEATFRVTKKRRGNYIFLTWAGDHGPAHVHVYRDGRLVVIFDLENRVAIKGMPSRLILRLIEELEEEGQL